MDALVKTEVEKTINTINQAFHFITDENLPTKEIIQEEFKSIRSLMDYCEKLALEGESAIETI